VCACEESEGLFVMTDLQLSLNRFIASLHHRHKQQASVTQEPAAALLTSFSSLMRMNFQND